MRLNPFTLFISFFIFSSLTFAEDPSDDIFTWNNSEYIRYYGDFNGDGTPDIFLQSKNMFVSNLYIPSTTNAERNAPLKSAVISLSALDITDYNQSRVVIGDFNGDGFDDLLNLTPSSNKAAMILGAKNVFDNPLLESVKVTGKVDFDLTIETPLYSGDFNGDGLDDILVVSPKFNGFVIYHADNKKGITFKRKDVIRFNTEHSQTVFIEDYNGDGFDDVMSFAQQSGKPNFVHLASDKGKFSDKDLHQLPAQIGGVDWNTNDYSLFNRKNSDDNSVDIVRNNNAIGGIDEEGNILDDTGNITTLSLEDLN